MLGTYKKGLVSITLPWDKAYKIVYILSPENIKAFPNKIHRTKLRYMCQKEKGTKKEHDSLSMKNMNP